MMTGRWLAGRAVWVVLAALTLAGGLIVIAPAGASASACVAWTGVQPPNVGAGDNKLLGVSTLSACDAWAVGSYSNGTDQQTLIEHWNGTAWKVVKSPNPGGSSNTNVLNGVAVTSRTDAWAVGSYDSASGTHALIEHWNGIAWKQVTSPAGFFLGGVTALSATNAWAVGSTSNSTAIQTLILHWNGTAWKVVQSPNPAGASRQNILYSVTATSSRNAWAVGDYSPGAELQTLILHWDGKAWRHVPSPNQGGSAQLNILKGVAAASRTSAWAVGRYDSLSQQTLIEHWNGTAWKLVKSPNPAGSGNPNLLEGVTAISSSNAWAVGSYYNGIRGATLALHWNGTAWKQVATPNPGGSATANIFNGVAATSRTNIWAVGFHFNGTVNHTLALHCC
jgi:hypothetical protein